MFDFDTWQEIFSTLRRNKLRTFLTAAGVFWGVFMLLLMLAFGHSWQSGITNKMGGSTRNAVFIWGEQTSLPFKGMQPGRPVNFDNADVAALRQAVPEIQYLAPRNQIGGFMGGFNVKREGKTGSFGVMGDVPDIRHALTIVQTRGRFLDDLDIAQRRKVAVIGDRVQEMMFEPGEDPVGKYLSVQGVYFQVVGVVRSRDAGFQGERQANTVHIPLSTFQQAFNQGDRIGWFTMTVDPGADAATVERTAKRVLAMRHSVDPADDRAMGSWNAGEMFAKMQKVFTGIQFFLWLVGTLTLLAGVVGVSNIMLIVVKERTREFGVRKALGATPWSVIALVIQEAVVLTALAGWVGIIAGVAAVDFLGPKLPELNDMFGPAYVDLRIALIATIILIVSGAFAGLMPARHAARINPVEALRAE
jgi:putative ABC transport system permease protein